MASLGQTEALPNLHTSSSMTGGSPGRHALHRAVLAHMVQPMHFSGFTLYRLLCCALAVAYPTTGFPESLVMLSFLS